MRVVYGVNPVKELLRAGAQGLSELWVAEGARSAALADLARQAEAAGARVKHAPRQRLDRLAGVDKHQGVVAVVGAAFRYAEVREILAAAEARNEPPLLVILDGVEDPHHLGAIARSAVAMGAHGVVIPQDRAVGVTPAAVKASAGVLERCLVARVVNVSRTLDDLKGAGVWSVALAADGEQELAQVDLKGPTALVVGSEGEGIRALVRKTCDHGARIGMAGGVESLSVSAAASVALYEAARQRRGRSPEKNRPLSP
ncbi:MAG: 23S rRNA (guanosine(2251)-2'-O)-methyltransferase RlmB [Anaeromyxobacter sp.]|nr:23S rRNA (guanosine(2251)-2'-O)-methyltransferase RlmB [Anaeromyxobacter sp.]MBL0277827.1 23S rRNA (guanosine(2251)-2'-O)-methyltransferase RlmB [Anaeromyxobacter sp.]